MNILMLLRTCLTLEVSTDIMNDRVRKLVSEAVQKSPNYLSMLKNVGNKQLAESVDVLVQFGKKEEDQAVEAPPVTYSALDPHAPSSADFPIVNDFQTEENKRANMQFLMAKLKESLVAISIGIGMIKIDEYPLAHDSNRDELLKERQNFLFYINVLLQAFNSGENQQQTEY